MSLRSRRGFRIRIHQVARVRASPYLSASGRRSGRARIVLYGWYSVEVVVKKLLALVAAALCMAACSDSSTGPSAASKVVAPANQGSRDDITCRSGYIVAFDENGNPYCAATDGAIKTPTGAASVPATPRG
jgi:hypothetical protein